MTNRAIILGPGGIGAALTRALVDRGWRCTIVARRQEPLERLAAAIPDLDCHQLDASDRLAMDELADRLAARGPYQAVVNAIGTILLKPAHRTTATEWQQTLDQNLTTAFNALRLGVATMPDGGSILLFSSAAAQVGLPHHEAIAAAKAGVEGLARAASATYAARGIRVNVLAPGLVETPLAAGILSTAAARKTSERMHPRGRIGSPADLVPPALQLLDPANDWVTGAVWSVDGGLASLRRS